MSKKIIMITWGGIGDVLLCTPTIRAIKESNPDHKIIVYASKEPHMEVFRNNPYVDTVRMLKPMRMWRYPYHLYVYLFNRKKVKFYSLSFCYIPVYYLYRINVRHIVPEIFPDLQFDRNIKNVQLFLTEAENRKAIESLLPYKNVIILHIYSRTYQNHFWFHDRWEALVKSLPEYTFIQLGLVDEPHIKGALDWRGKTNLREAFALIKHATSFVGIDSSHAHVTNAFNTPGVVLFGDSPPICWGHENNINIYMGVKCSPCSDYLLNNPCPFNNSCMKLITVDMVRDALIKQVNHRTKTSRVGNYA